MINIVYFEQDVLPFRCGNSCKSIDLFPQGSHCTRGRIQANVISKHSSLMVLEAGPIVGYFEFAPWSEGEYRDKDVLLLQVAGFPIDIGLERNCIFWETGRLHQW
jgi:hypothetical protein